MKKEVNKIVMAIGFVLVVLGTIIMGIETVTAVQAIFSYAILASVFATTFIFSKNGVVKNVGYALGALSGAYGIATISNLSKGAGAGLIIMSVGMIFMLLASIFYFFVLALCFFGFVKGNTTKTGQEELTNILIRYKELQQEKVLTEEEYEELKRKILEATKEKDFCFDDLKKWKKMLDQQVITEEEFATMKAKVLQ